MLKIDYCIKMHYYSCDTRQLLLIGVMDVMADKNRFFPQKFRLVRSIFDFIAT